MSKSIFTDAYTRAVARLVELRKEANLTQTQLAVRLGKSQQWISYIEQHERRLDIIEFHDIACALGADPLALYEEVTKGLPRSLGPDRPQRPSGRRPTGTR